MYVRMHIAAPSKSRPPDLTYIVCVYNACMHACMHVYTYRSIYRSIDRYLLPLTHTLPPSVSAPPQDLLLSCRLSTQIASEIGAFGIAPAELVDMMAGTRITLNTDIGSYTRAFAGECSR